MFISYNNGNGIVDVDDILRIWRNGDTIYAKFKSGADENGDDEVEISTHDSIDDAESEFEWLRMLLGVDKN